MVFAGPLRAGPFPEVRRRCLTNAAYEQMLRTEGSQERFDNLAELAVGIRVRDNMRKRLPLTTICTT